MSALCGLLLYKACDHAKLFDRLSAELGELVGVPDAWAIEGEPKVRVSADDVDAGASVEVWVGIGFGFVSAGIGLVKKASKVGGRKRG